MDPPLMWLSERKWFSAPSSTRLGDPEEYRRKLEESLTLDAEGKPFRMLVFKPSPRSCKKGLFLVDEMMQDEKKPSRTLWLIPLVRATLF
ncbi:hypothetical protein J5N97_024311 [Dioscorea zingiberensis]|uniref:Uncharacterized protein n=1 Tax=Dioscorea zingiberensis TaxID=325984 RepID=A0A9D5C767_9LILI|nr:hypothetical protein J5N97_024311 [Dioscorea zingiberensis]